MDIVRAVLFPASPATGGVPLNVIIDAMKGLTPVYILYMIASHGAWENTTAWIYFGIHGCYGILWCAKSWTGFGDHRWKRPVPLWNACMTLLGLALYWLPIGLIVDRPRGQEAPAWLLGVCVMLFGLGVFWHFASGISVIVCVVDLTHRDRYAKNNVFGVSRTHEIGGRRQQGRQGIFTRFD
jgi:hypothetical protein